MRARLEMLYLQEGKRESCDQGRLQTSSRGCRHTDPSVFPRHELCNAVVLQRLCYFTSLRAPEIQPARWCLASSLSLSLPHCTDLEGTQQGEALRDLHPRGAARRGRKVLPMKQGPMHNRCKGFSQLSITRRLGTGKEGVVSLSLIHLGFNSGHWAEK